MDPDQQVPADLDIEQPSAARIYDFILGGAHNFDVDRRVAERLFAMDPDAPRTAHANRAFLRRAVQYLVDAGVRQFLDLGSGIPTVGHVHEIAQRAAPESRVVYVDIDPIAVAHSRQILGDDPRTTAIQADVREPDQILDHPDVRRLLDFDQPVAVLIVALLHMIGDASDPAGLVDRLTRPLPPGSYVAVSHLTDDGTADVAGGRDVFRQAGIELTLRSRAQVEALFAGWEPVPPGLVWAPLWHPDQAAGADERAGASGIYAGVARRP